MRTDELEIEAARTVAAVVRAVWSSSNGEQACWSLVEAFGADSAPVVLDRTGERRTWGFVRGAPEPAFDGSAWVVEPRSIRITALGQESDTVRLEVLLARRADREPFSRELLAILEKLVRDDLIALADRLAEPIDPSATAWERSNIPLVYLKSDGTIVDANPSAQRKLGVLPSGELPDWLRRRTLERLPELAERGLPADQSGDYLFEKDADGEYRIGLAPLNETDLFLLSVEVAGPDLDQRLDRFAERYRLTESEREVLHCMASGLRNKQIAKQLDLAEATVKWRVTDLFRSVKVTNRTALLALFYGAGDPGDDDAG